MWIPDQLKQTEKNELGRIKMKYLFFSNITKYLENFGKDIPGFVKTVFYFSISVALFSVSAIIFLICWKIAQSILGME
jgi:hypothetical protein